MAARDFPHDDNFTPEEAEGFRAFWDGQGLERMPGADDPGRRRGWWLAWARAYGQGVKASLQDAASGREALSPYRQFSGPWEAWSSGYDEEDGLESAI